MSGVGETRRSRQPVLGFLPPLRSIKKLQQRAPGGERKQKPIEWRQHQHSCVGEQPSSFEPDHVKSDGRDIAAEECHGKHRRGIHRPDRLQRREGKERIAKPGP